MGREPVHVAVVTLGEELAEPPGRFGNRIRRGDADDIETLTPRVGEEGLLQKSRLA
jgi:hypothetical protein